MNKRKHIPDRSMLASALLEIQLMRITSADEQYKFLQAAKQVSVDDFLRWWAFHHNRYYAEGGSDHFSNLTPILRGEHNKRTAEVDIPQIAKSKRIKRKHLEHLKRMGREAPDLNEATLLEAMIKVAAPKRKRRIPSRPFPRRRPK